MINSSFLKISTLILAVPLILSACGGSNTSDDDQSNPDPQIETATEAELQTLIDGNNRFALDFYRQQPSDENVFFSPYSLSSAFAMVYEGAADTTAQEIAETFHFTVDNNALARANAALYQNLNRSDQNYQLNTANALWVQQDYDILSQYISLLEDYYQAQAENLDFINDPDNSRTTINDWVAAQTNDKIQDLFPEGSINQLTRLVLTNAIYFKGNWATQFDPDNTSPARFTLDDGSTVEVEMMNQRKEDLGFRYADLPDLQVLSMPYVDQELELVVLLPKGDLNTLKGQINQQSLQNWLSQLTERDVIVGLPKFKLETKYSLNQTLKDMGVRSAFTAPSNDSGANFSDITGTRELFIQTAIHQAFIEVNEEGTEAAAATGVSVGVTSFNPEARPEFIADHPFIFLIQDPSNQNILFMGQVINPSGETPTPASDDSTEDQFQTFEFRGDSYSGPATVSGYPVIQEITEPFCDQDCATYQYVSLMLTSDHSGGFQNFLNENQGNAYAGQNQIGLGCLQSNQIQYSNQVGSEFKNFQLSTALTDEILAATEANPITLELYKEPIAGGTEGPACYSHFTSIN